MSAAVLPPDEVERLNILRSYEILDSESEEAFDAMVQLASYICQTPIAVISLVDESRQWFKAAVGLDVKETSRDVSFCAHTILQDGAMVVADARFDERFSDNPLVLSSPGIRFYAGIPLTTSAGYRLGTLCVIDKVPRELSATQLGAIKTLADNVMAHLDLVKSHKQARLHIDNLELAASIFNAASEAMFVSDADNCILTVNPAFTAITGYSQEEIVGKSPSILSSGRQTKQFYQKMWLSLKETGSWKGELWNRRKSGQLYAQQLSINVIYRKGGDKGLHVAIFSDITHRKQTEELIWRQANFDHLTQLPNRMLFLNRMECEVALAQRTQIPLALLFIDLDHFKAVNDNMGHDAGDELLMQAADRIRSCVRETDTVARLGGDEFTVILLQLSEPAYGATIAKKIIAALEVPFVVRDVELSLSASVGLAICPKDGDTPERLLKSADQAMYDAKKAGRGRFCLFADA
jgi:diguanylate cyclase (GGDEF)-like protein/PAS domain S-box-containing protein